MRESPYVKLVEYFLGKGYEIRIYDPNIQLSKLIGANKAVFENELSHIDKLLVKNLKDVFESEIILIARNDKIDQYILDKHYILDLR